MKCGEAEKWILLKDSGEWAGKSADALLSHLHKCDECRRFQHAMVESQEVFQTLEEPSATVLNNVKREARMLAPESTKAMIFRWKPALAMAASALIGLGLFLTAFRPDHVGLELTMSETDLLAPGDQVVSVMYSGLSDDDLAFNFLMTYDGEG